MKSARFAVLAALGLACGGTASNSLDPTQLGQQEDAGGSDSSTAGAAGSAPNLALPDGPPGPGLPGDASDASDAGRPAETNPVVSLSIVPLTEHASVNPYMDRTVRFYCSANRRDGSSTDVTDDATWTSSASHIAYVFHPGVLVPLSPGTVNVQAAFEGATVTATLTIDGVAYVGFHLDVPQTVLMVGDSEDLTVTVNYPDISGPSVTEAMTWESTPPGIVAVTAPGHLVAVAAGSTLLQAKLDGEVVGSVQLIVVSAPPTSIALTPNKLDINLSESQQFAAMGTFADMTMLDVTSAVQWSAIDSGVVNFDTSNRGLLHTQQFGTTTITASWHQAVQSAQVNVLVGNPLTIMVDDVSIHRFEGVPVPTVFVAYPNGSVYELSNVVNWSVGNSTIATIGFFNGQKFVIGQNPGVTNLRADLMGKAAGAGRVTVLPTALLSIQVSPPGVFLPPPQKMSVTGTYADDSTADVGVSASWRITDTSIATVNSTPGEPAVVTSVAAGKTSITATVGTITGTAVITAFR